MHIVGVKIVDIFSISRLKKLRDLKKRKNAKGITDKPVSVRKFTTLADKVFFFVFYRNNAAGHNVLQCKELILLI